MVDFHNERVHKRGFRDTCATTNAYIEQLYESSGKEDKEWGDADSNKLFSLVNMRANSKYSQTLRGSFILQAAPCYTENIGRNEEFSPLSVLFIILLK